MTHSMFVVSRWKELRLWKLTGENSVNMDYFEDKKDQGKTPQAPGPINRNINNRRY